MSRLLLAPLLRWLGRLGHPRLFMVAAALFAITVVVPDPIPFVDELLLGIATLLLAGRKRDPVVPPVDGRARRG